MGTSATDALTPLLQHAKEVVDECLPDGPSGQSFDSNTLEDRLNPVLFAVLSAGRSTSCVKLSEVDRADLWHIVCKLWNVCVEKHNECDLSERWMINLRESASDLLTLIEDSDLSLEERATKASFYHKIGCTHAELKEYEAAEASFGKAHEYSASLLLDLQQAEASEDLLADFADDYCLLLISRAKNAWQLQQKELANGMLASAAENAQLQSLPSRQRFHLLQSVILTFVEQGRHMVEGKDADAVSLLDNAFKLITGHLELDEDDEDFEVYQKEACYLQAQVLRLLAQAYLFNGRAATALQCIHNLRKIQEEEASQPAMHLIAIQALIQMNQKDDAELELLALAAHRCAPISLCLEALSAMIHANGSNENLKTAADLIIERFPGEPSVPVKIVELILGQRREDVGKDQDKIALQIISEQYIVDLLIKDEAQAKGHRKAMYIMLWNHGTQLFTSKAYEACSQFYSAALMYADDAAKPVVARQLALAHMATQNLDTALEYLAIALELEPDSIYSIFVKIKVLLMKGAAHDAVNELQNLLACEEFNTDFLRVICTEAMAAKTAPVAKEALLCLHKRISEGREGQKPGEEAVVLRSLIKVVADDAQGYDLANGTCITAAQVQLDEPKDTFSVHAELCMHYSKAEQRLQSVGPATFFGDETAQLEWFANSSFNAGLAAAHSRDYMSAAVLFGAAGTFYGHFRTANVQSLSHQQEAFAMAANCALEAHLKHDHVPSLSLAQHMLQQARAIADKLTKLPHGPSDTQNSKIPTFLLQMEFDIATRQRDEASQLALLDRCKAADSFSAEKFLQLAKLCRGPRSNCPSVAKEAFKIGLQAMLAHPSTVSYDMLAQTIRNLMELSSDAEKLSLLQDTTKLLGGLQPDSYPCRELAWLLTTAWNRGCHHAKYKRLREAQQFMEAALKLIDFCANYQSRKQVLAGELKRVVDMQQASTSMNLH